jgi:putative Mg2+ transporter-C (MgtC) family protein
VISLAEALDPGSRDFWSRIGAALLCGGSIGLDRQLRGKAAGMRTSILICLGTAIFVALGASFAPQQSDPTRVLGQVVTGIGFLGAGVILAREGRILGVTTAAVIWMLAAVGSLIGLGYLRAAVVLTLITLGVLIGVTRAEIFWERRRGHRVSQELEGIEIE